MEKIKNLVNILAGIIWLAGFAGLFGWNISEGGTMFLGLGMLVCVTWAAVLVNKK